MEGVVRAPSLFSKTTGSPPSMTDMQEFVVPKSIPKTLAIKFCSFRDRELRSNGLSLAIHIPGGSLSSKGGISSELWIWLQSAGNEICVTTAHYRFDGASYCL